MLDFVFINQHAAEKAVQFFKELLAFFFVEVNQPVVVFLDACPFRFSSAAFWIGKTFP